MNYRVKDIKNKEKFLNDYLNIIYENYILGNVRADIIVDDKYILKKEKCIENGR